MSKGALGTLIVIGAIAVILLLFVLSGVGVWNSLNRNLQSVNGAQSHYSAALNTCTEKIKGVWEIANQYMTHESETFKAVAEARSGYTAAAESFSKAMSDGKGAEALTKSGADAARAAFAFRLQVEAYPQLRASETSQQNMRNLEEAVNEIKTALDDWISAIKTYNIYRGSAWPAILGNFMTKFPAEIKYYEGEVKKLNVEELNPENKKK
jgi:LemA protein